MSNSHGIHVLMSDRMEKMQTGDHSIIHRRLLPVPLITDVTCLCCVAGCHVSSAVFHCNTFDIQQLKRGKLGKWSNTGYLKVTNKKIHQRQLKFK